MLPSGDMIWVHLGETQAAAACDNTPGAADAGLGERLASAGEALRVPGFAETIRGIIASIHEAVDDHRPDSLTVEFGVELTARTGAVVSVLAEGGGTAHVKVTASWGRQDTQPAMPAGEEP